MKWLEMTLDTPDTEALSIELDSLGVEGVIIEDYRDFTAFLEQNRACWDYVDEELAQSYQNLSRVKFYLPDDSGGIATLERIKAQLGVNPVVSRVEDSDWENNWREHYRPIEIGKRLLIVPEWLEAEMEGRVNLRLDPGLAFGTGSHPTTKMCLAALEKYCGSGKRVLDIGSGSGILGIGALLLGCDSVSGCDIDEKAVDAALSNAALNGIGGDRFKVYKGNILEDGELRARLGGGYDIVLANIVADVIVQLAGRVRDFLAPGGVFICSGVIDGRQDEVAAALRSAGFSILAHDTMEEWHCMTAQNIDNDKK